MASPLPNEKELYEKIEKEKITIPASIGDLFFHHIGNDVYAISLIASSHVTGDDKEPIPIEDGQKILKHCEAIRVFLKNLYEATRPK
ncbi:MAG: hypothetical protein HZA27_03145 [Candidatus Omnitrophica bacterium]|nr:hypothetical protein [Candidatus Omnitrophota bacterium]